MDNTPITDPQSWIRTNIIMYKTQLFVNAYFTNTGKQK